MSRLVHCIGHQMSIEDAKMLAISVLLLTLLIKKEFLSHF